MKLHKLVLLLLTFSLTIIVSYVSAQDGKDLKRMDKDDWQRQFDEFSARKTKLTNQLNSLNADVDALKKMNKDRDDELEKSENDHYGSVGATKSQVAEYRRKFESVEKLIYSASGTKEEIRTAFDEIEASNIRCLPEFWDRFQGMKKKLRNG